jgi:acyl-coenzyme A synthetase/AMP-(fatty) acid ligase
MDRPAFEDVVTSEARRQAYLSAGLWNDWTLAGRVALHAMEAPDAVAIIDEFGRYTYGQLAVDAAAMAGALTERGVTAGSVVSIQLPNRYEAAVAAVAVESLGAVINPLLPNYRVHEVSNVFEAAAPTAIFTPAEYRNYDHRQLVREVIERTGHKAHHIVVGGDAGPDGEAFDALLSAGRNSTTLSSPPADAVSELIFTSGTEAKPKAIMHTEQTACFSARDHYNDMELGPDDVVWMPSPVGHSTGFNFGIRLALIHRLPLVLQDRWNGEAAAALVDKEQCSYTLAATTFLQDVTEAAAKAGLKLDSMRNFTCGGSPVPAELVDAAEERGIQALRLYGSTEILVGTTVRSWSPPDKKRTTDGLALSHVELQARDDEGNVVEPGQPGELYTRGPDTCVGFFNDPERTAATFDSEGWVKSGDMVTIDADGYLTVVGRKKEIIIRGGMNIAPREIEDLLLTFPEIERCAVVGVPDERLGEKMAACVVLRSGASLEFDTMVNRLKDMGLATYKLPQRLEFLESLPSTASGKIQKHEIVRQLLDQS